ncbi:uncharacterized protein BCR38DRAFT_409084 [Pseudomassariella vexata]|uniref:Uncharacterized protein n=1 Tax=Pseudomassariella vexata TaxID=1141098 RepID=A0A1Y2E1F6_9PEZI|nr:uncharacterized protein BCR38DRAFT_409084 [Pseudomassariella vexata]ORY65378.1 hypothetical protein BCR38DRAFT_409084 [Pseudomassariella vexata]
MPQRDPAKKLVPLESGGTSNQAVSHTIQSCVAGIIRPAYVQPSRTNPNVARVIRSDERRRAGQELSRHRGSVFLKLDFRFLPHSFPPDASIASHLPKGVHVAVEAIVHFFKRPPPALLEEQKHVGHSGDAEGAEDYVYPPLDILECRGRKES